MHTSNSIHLFLADPGNPNSTLNVSMGILSLVIQFSLETNFARNGPEWVPDLCRNERLNWSRIPRTRIPRILDNLTDGYWRYIYCIGSIDGNILNSLH